MDDYIRIVHKNTEMFSTYDPDTLLKILDECAEKMGAEMEVYAGKYKARLKMATEMDNIEMKVNILKVDEAKNCVEFNRVLGDQIEFLNLYNKIKGYFGEFNDAAF